MRGKIKKIISKFVCLHNWSEPEGVHSPDELIIQFCKKCGKLKLSGGYMIKNKSLKECVIYNNTSKIGDGK